MMARNAQEQGKVIDEDDIQNMTVEEQLFLAAETGNAKMITELTENTEENGLDINAVNSQGLGAMNIAVKNGFLIPLLMLIDAGGNINDTLLRAVDADFEEAVQYLVEYATDLQSDEKDAILKCKSVTNDIHPDVTPIIRAAQKNNFTLVKILFDAGLRVEDFGVDDFTTTTSTNDSLQISVGTLEIYRALASPAYVCFDPDPIGRAFHLSSLLRKLALLEVEFKLTYLELANGMEQYAADIVSYTVTTEEAMSILAYHGTENSGKSEKAIKALGLLPTISRAIAHDQKKFVAEPTCQHVLRVQFSRQLISLQDRPFIFSIFLRILIILLFPVLCIVYKLGISKSCNDFVKIPMVKFFMQLGSDLLLLGMILYETTWYTSSNSDMAELKPWHYMIYVYALGMLWREILYIWKKRDQRNVVKIMNMVNITIGMLLLALVNNQIAWQMLPDGCEPMPIKNTMNKSTSMSRTMEPTNTTRFFPNPDINYTIGLNDSGNIEDIVNDFFQVIYVELDHDIFEINMTIAKALEEDIIPLFNYTLQHRARAQEQSESMPEMPEMHCLMLLSRSIMAIIVVISFTRIQPFFITIDSVGPLSISFKSMFVTTGQFLSVVVAVLFGFATGLTYIYRDSYQHNAVTGQSSCKDSGGRGGSCSDTNYYESLPQSMFTLYWSLFGLIPTHSVKSDNIPTVLVSMGELLYASFYVFTVLVLLNGLIAVMSNVYNVVEENADTEWKFHRTYLFMSFLDETFTVPPPFNLLPQLGATTTNLLKRIKQFCCCLCNRRKTQEVKITSRRNEILMDDIGDEGGDRYAGTRDFCRVDESTYKRVTSTLVERYIAEKTQRERKQESDITVADMRNLKNDVIGLRYNLFKEVWCINEKLELGNTESDLINSEMTTVQDVFNALAKNKEDFQHFETNVQMWIKHMVERLENLPDVDQFESAIKREGWSHPPTPRGAATNTVGEMVGRYEALRRQKTKRIATKKLLNELME